MATLNVDEDGPIPKIKIHVGRAQFARFSFGLWDKSGGTTIKHDVYEKGVNDEFRIVRTRAELAKLDGNKLDGVVWVMAFKGGQQRYKVTVKVTQGDTVLDTWDSAGTFSTMKNLMKIWTIKLV
ncbi:MAG: hypothetical protein OES69_08765 [Myxococcales bacterium]|nr:hypothetical protein [Myxococcales bacterium]